MVENFSSKNKLGSARGFSIIELMVVIGIVSTLSSVVLASSMNLKFKAQKARVQSDLVAFVTVAMAARGSTGKSIQNIVGGAAPENACLSMDLRNISSGSSCYVGWKNALSAIQNASGGLTGISGMLRDPWGSPYLLDWGNCNTGAHDVIYSAGPNGWTNAWAASDDPITFDGDDIYLYLGGGPGCPQ